MTDSRHVAEGARNLLFECGNFEKGDKLLIVREDPALGWYDEAAPLAVADEARRLGMAVETLGVGAPTNRRDSSSFAAIASHRTVVFFARIGDQERFEIAASGDIRIMSYIRSAAMLASDFGRVSHAAMTALKTAVNEALLGARLVQITCPLGTSVAGVISRNQRPDGDVSVRRFPMGVPVPILADRFSGDVVLANYLTPTGSKVYHPPWLKLDEPVVARMANGKIKDILGRADLVSQVREHYAHVASLFGIEDDTVHSWHAGIHPGLRYDQEIAKDPDRWSNSVFVQPRYLHFHTCGDYPPGEICWMIADHSVAIDGIMLWEAGCLHPERHPATATCLEEFPELESMFEIG